jgi:hypothetical protein
LVGKTLAKIPVEDGCSDLQHEMCSTPRPLHLLLFDHAAGNKGIDGRLGQGCCDPAS